MLSNKNPPFYNVVPAEDAQHPSVQDSTELRLQPKRLDNSWLTTSLRLLLDLLIASIALLFAVFGFLVYRSHGKPADPGSTGLKLFQAAQFVRSLYLTMLNHLLTSGKAPTVFPVLFAAIAGGSIKSIASWRIQTKQGATLGLVEQCLGSQTLVRAFTTQITMRALNFFGIFIICLWSLSPLGSQASLRVISIIPSYPSTSTPLTAHNTTVGYAYGNANGVATAITSVAGSTIASMLAASLLAGRNQDLWGNIRFPAIEPLGKQGDKGWFKVPEVTNLTYPSLVGTPISNLPGSGNTSFILPGSYLSISCPVFERSDQSELTNYTATTYPVPDNDYDCAWASNRGGNQWMIAISKPCGNIQPVTPNTTRNARKLIWESRPVALNDVFTRAECSLTTAFVDVNVSCTGSSSGSVCNPSVVRHSPKPTFHYNWTVFDIGFPHDAKSVLQILADLFPSAQLSGGTQPVLNYLTQPYNILSKTLQHIPLHTIDRNVFELRLAQLLNTVLYIGINQQAFTGGFNTSDPGMQQTSLINITGTNSVREEIIHCDEKWLAVLLLASLTAFILALAGAYLRVITLAPDLLGSSSLALLHNKVGGIPAFSTWSSETWIRELKHLRLFLGDVEPQGQVGRIALATDMQETVVNPVRTDRYYI